MNSVCLQTVTHNKMESRMFYNFIRSHVVCSDDGDGNRNLLSGQLALIGSRNGAIQFEKWRQNRYYQNN